MKNFTKILFSSFFKPKKQPAIRGPINFFHSIIVFALLFSSLVKAQNSTINADGSKEFIIDDIYKSVQKPNTVKAFYFKFAANSNHYSLVLNSRLTMAIIGNELYITTRDNIGNTNPQQGKILNKYQLNSKAAFVYFVYEILPEKTVSAQMIETDNKGNYLTNTPIYTMTTHSFNDNTVQNKLKIENVNSNSVITIQSMAFYTHPEVSRYKRDLKFSQLECMIPVLSIANQFMNRPCDIIKSSLTYIFGNQNSPSSASTGSTSSPTNQLNWELTDYIFTGQKDAYAGYSASQSCKVPLQSVFSTRKPRSPESIDCVYDVMDVLTPYLIITNYDFDRAHFQQTVSNILTNGSSGISAAHSPELEQELVSAVQAARTRANQATINFSSEFHRAANLNGSTVSFQSLVAGDSVYGSAPQATPVPTASNTPTDQIAIGNYELDLAGVTLNSFRQSYSQIVPRTYSQNQWRTSSTPFTSEVITNPTPSQINELRSMLNQWYPTSSSSSSSESDSDSDAPIVSEGYIRSENLLRTGRSLASGLIDELDERNTNSVAVVIRHQNSPSSILFGYVNTEAREATVAYALTNPNNLRTPYSSTAVRGSGQQALQQFIEYCINQNIYLVHTYASTKVSANVKKKFGFKYEDENSGPSSRFARDIVADEDMISLIGGNQIKGEEVEFTGKGLKAAKRALIYDSRGILVNDVQRPFINGSSIRLKSTNPGLHLIIVDGKTYKVMVIQ